MGKIKIKHRTPKRQEFTPNDIVINVKNGTLFYKSNFAIFRLQGVQTTRINPQADTISVNIEQAEHQQILFNNNSVMDGSENFKYTFTDDGTGVLSDEKLVLGANMDISGIFSSTGDIHLKNTTPSSPNTGVILGTESAGSLYVKTPHVEIKIGPRNSSFSHFYTDRSKYYFNKRIVVNEGIVSTISGDDLQLSCDLHNTNKTHIVIKNSSTDCHVDIHGDVIAKPKGNNFGKLMAENDVIAFASDKRLKENIVEISNPLDKIQQVRGVYFDWNQKSKEEGFKAAREKNEIGMIAQEVEQIIPQAIEPAPFNKEYKTIKYDRLIPLLVECIKDQQKQINELKSKIA